MDIDNYAVLVIDLSQTFANLNKVNITGFTMEFTGLDL